MGETIETYMERASYDTSKSIKGKIAILKEPLLKKILSGEIITERDEGYLSAIYDIEEVLQGYANEMNRDE